jgi:hypothetical protein
MTRAKLEAAPVRQTARELVFTTRQPAAQRGATPMHTAACRSRAGNSALHSTDPARAELTALVASHGLRSGQLRALQLTDLSDRCLYLHDRIVLLADPRERTPRRLHPLSTHPAAERHQPAPVHQPAQLHQNRPRSAGGSEIQMSLLMTASHCCAARVQTLPAPAAPARCLRRRRPAISTVRPTIPTMANGWTLPARRCRCELGFRCRWSPTAPPSWHPSGRPSGRPSGPLR